MLYFGILYPNSCTSKGYLEQFSSEVFPVKSAVWHYFEGAHDGRFGRFDAQCSLNFSLYLENEDFETYVDWVC